jgi:replicative DNA helicase
MKKSIPKLKAPNHIREITDITINNIASAAKTETGINGIPSGFEALDRITNGWQNSDLIIVGGRPSMGKTAFILTMLRNIAINNNLPTLFFSIENSESQIVNRLITAEAEISSERLRSGRLEDFEWEQLNRQVKSLVEAPIYIDSDPTLNTSTLKNKCFEYKEKYDIKCFFLDYAQLMKADPSLNGNWEQDVNIISRELKRLALELDTPFIVTSQLNRKIESRMGYSKKPMLCDLRDSGALEEDADVVVLLHRPERYGITEDEEGNSLIGISDVIVAKHRNGAVGEIQLRFQNRLAKFSNLEVNHLNSEFECLDELDSDLVGGNNFEDAPPF